MKYSALPLALLLACDAAVVAQDGKAAPVLADGQPAVAVKATIEAEALDLESIHFLVKKGKVKDAAALEKQINDPKEKLNNVDVDGDGKVDKIQIVEVKKDNGGSTFELKAIPSKSKDKDAALVVAVIHFDPDKTAGKLIVKAEFTPIVISADTFLFIHETAITVQGDTIVLVEPNPFFSWFLIVNRPVFVGVFVYEAAPTIIKKRHWHRHKGKWKGKG